jgi:hypothetical protein
MAVAVEAWQSSFGIASSLQQRGDRSNVSVPQLFLCEVHTSM